MWSTRSCTFEYLGLVPGSVLIYSELDRVPGPTRVAGNLFHLPSFLIYATFKETRMHKDVLWRISDTFVPGRHFGQSIFESQKVCNLYPRARIFLFLWRSVYANYTRGWKFQDGHLARYFTEVERTFSAWKRACARSPHSRACFFYRFSLAPDIFPKWQRVKSSGNPSAEGVSGKRRSVDVNAELFNRTWRTSGTPSARRFPWDSYRFIQVSPQVFHQSATAGIVTLERSLRISRTSSDIRTCRAFESHTLTVENVNSAASSAHLLVLRDANAIKMLSLSLSLFAKQKL